MMKIHKKSIAEKTGCHSRLDRESSLFWIPASAGINMHNSLQRNIKTLIMSYPRKRVSRVSYKKLDSGPRLLPSRASLKTAGMTALKNTYGSMMILLAILFVFFILSPFASADETIKVLMIDSPNDPQPSEQAEKVESLNGKVFYHKQSYSGSFDIMRDENGLYLVNTVPFEKYIEGVVASEVGKNWRTEALKAQAVISRTYALFNKNLHDETNYDLTSSVLHQVYKGENMDPLIAQAVESTKGEILTYEGKPVNAFYHATCKGSTELPEEVWTERYPYLKSVECNGKNTPYETWTKQFTSKQISEALGIPGFKEINIRSYTATGRVKVLTILMNNTMETIEIKATDLRKKLGYKELPSTDFTVSMSDTDVVFNGSGYGHGVGLSQWGALEMAQEGKNYKEILAHYYPGTEIRKKEDLHTGTQAQRDKGTQ